MINGMRLCLYTYVYIYSIVLLGRQGRALIGHQRLVLYSTCVGVYYCPHTFKYKTTAFAAIYELIFFFQPWNHIMKNYIYCLIFVLKIDRI